MKRNVDLTENRFFSNNDFNFVNKRFFDFDDSNDSDFKRNVFFDMYDDCHIKTIIIVGNKATRDKVRYFKKMNSSKYCDCCGTRLNLKPWYTELGLCHRCSNHLENRRDKCKWRRKEIIYNARII